MVWSYVRLLYFHIPHSTCLTTKLPSASKKHESDPLSHTGKPNWTQDNGTLNDSPGSVSVSVPVSQACLGPQAQGRLNCSQWLVVNCNRVEPNRKWVTSKCIGV